MVLLWPWDDFVRPIRTYFARRRRSRWKPRYEKGECSSCKLPFNNGKKRCVVDSCGHQRCYECLCAQDACPVCLQEMSNETIYRKRLKISNQYESDLNYKDICDEKNSKRVSQISNINSDLLLEATFSNGRSSNITLKPLYFEVPQQDVRSSFLYRGWIFEEIAQVIFSSHMRGIALIGNQGSGKTSIILQLVDWSIFGRKRKSGIISDVAPCSLDTFEKLASQVVGYHFCQVDCRETCLIPDFIHSLAAQLCQAPQLSEYRNFLLQDESYQQMLNLDSCVEDPDKAFLKGILEPLSSLSNCPLLPSLLVIDSVHEAEGHSRSISSFLSTHVSHFPTWLKIVITVNNENASIVQSLRLQYVNLNSVEIKVKEDLLRYIRSRVDRSAILQANVSACGGEEQISRFANHLITGGQTSFLFVKLILDLLQQNHLVIKSSSFNVIPVSLDEVKPILEICLASYSPLTAVEIFYSLECASVVPSFSWQSFSDTLHSLSGILIQRKDESLMVSHPALRDWLSQNTKFKCETRSGHTYLALLPTRLRQPLIPGKEVELVYHLSRCNLFEEEYFKSLWLNHSTIIPSTILVNPRVLFWPDKQVFHLLLKAGADASHLTDTPQKVPILNIMCRFGFPEVVDLLNFGADPNKTDVFGMTPLMEAADGGHLKIVEMLLEAGAKIHHQDNVGRCALSCAAAEDHLIIVEALIKRDTWPPFSRSQAIQRALVAAAGSGKFMMCEYLMKVKDSSEQCIRDFKLSYSRGHQALCQFIVNNDVAGPDKVIQAAVRGHPFILQALIDKGISMDNRDKTGRTAFSWVCIYGKIDIINYLLEKRVELNVQDNNSCTPLHLAAMYGNGDIVNLLLEHVVDTEHRNKDGKTPLECAISARNFSSTSALLKSGADIGCKAFECAKENPKLCYLLLNKILADGISLYKKGQVIDAKSSFEYALQKVELSENSEQIRYQLQEGLNRCKFNL